MHNIAYLIVSWCNIIKDELGFPQELETDWYHLLSSLYI